MTDDQVMGQDDNVVVDKIELALIGVDVLESVFDFSPEQSAQWMDEFLSRLQRNE